MLMVPSFAALLELIWTMKSLRLPRMITLSYEAATTWWVAREHTSCTKILWIRIITSYWQNAFSKSQIYWWNTLYDSLWTSFRPFVLRPCCRGPSGWASAFINYEVRIVLHTSLTPSADGRSGDGNIICGPCGRGYCVVHVVLKESYCFICMWKQSGAVEACWAHNPEVRRSKLRSANFFLLNQSTEADSFTVWPNKSVVFPQSSNPVRMAEWSKAPDSRYMPCSLDRE